MIDSLHIFHNLPSGGGARALASILPFLSGRHSLHLHAPEGSARIGTADSAAFREWPFPEGGRISWKRKMLGPLPFMKRLEAFGSLCERIAAEIDSSGTACALVHNSMFVAAPPLLGYMSTPGLYYCYEYPRHIYERDIIRRSRNRLQEMLLSPLVKAEADMDRKSVLAAAGVVTLSSYMASRLHDIYGISAGVARPGIDCSIFSPGEDNPSGGGYALSVGALWPFKGHELFIRAAAGAGIREAVIVADREYPGYRRILEETACRTGTRLLILKSLAEAELLSLYRSAAVVACCQQAEPYGLVPLEAMACARPVVAVAEGGFPENIEDGITGLLVERSLENVSDAMRRIVENPALARSLGGAGREFVTTGRRLESAAEALETEISRTVSSRAARLRPSGPSSP